MSKYETETRDDHLIPSRAVTKDISKKKHHSIMFTPELWREVSEFCRSRRTPISTLIEETLSLHLHQQGSKNNPLAVTSWDTKEFDDKVIQNRFPVMLYGASGNGKTTTVMKWVHQQLLWPNKHNYGIIILDAKGKEYDFGTEDPLRQETYRKLFYPNLPAPEGREHGCQGYKLINIPTMSADKLYDLRHNPWPRFFRVTINQDRAEYERGRDFAYAIRTFDEFKEIMKAQPYEWIFIVDEAFKISQYPEFSMVNPYQVASLKGFASTLREYTRKAIFIGQEPFLRDIFKCIEVIP